MPRITGILAGITLLATACSTGSPGPTDALRAPGPDTARVPTVVAKTPIAAGSVLSADKLELVDWPESLRPVDTLAAIDDAVGLHTGLPLEPGDLVRASQNDPTTSLRPGVRTLPFRSALVDGSQRLDLWVDRGTGYCAAIQGVLLHPRGGGLELVIPEDKVDSVLAAVHHPSFRHTSRREDDATLDEGVGCR